MALQAVVYQQGDFSHKNDANKDFYSLLENWSWEFNLPKSDQEIALELLQNNGIDQNPWEMEIKIPPLTASNSPEAEIRTTPSSTRPKRRRTARIKKNKEEIESQRMTHIAVERNRRKQMNNYLSILKSLMPHSYVKRSDQASVVGAAINFVKELEQNLHSLSAQNTSPFQECFSFPQYSTMADLNVGNEAKKSTVADVEVSIAEGHANLKIRSRKHPKQLLKLVTGLQNLKLTVLHLNVNALDQFSFYSFNLKVEDDSMLDSAEEVATAVHQLLVMIQEEI